MLASCTCSMRKQRGKSSHAPIVWEYESETAEAGGGHGHSQKYKREGKVTRRELKAGEGQTRNTMSRVRR